MSSDTQHPAERRHTLRQQPWRSPTQLVMTLALVVIVGIIIGALYLFETTRYTTSARVLEQMVNDLARLERDNERLRAEIAELESLPRVMTRAAELGFRDARPEEIQWVLVEGYRYNRPRVTPTPTPSPMPGVPDYDETLGGWFRKQWDSLKRQFDNWRSGE